MTGVKSKVVIAGVAALALSACSSGPSAQQIAMQKWTAGSGGKCLAKVECGLTHAPLASLSSGGEFTQAIRCETVPPPVGKSLYISTMAEISAASLFGAGEFDSSESTADQDKSATAAERALSAAEADAKGAPAADTWVPALAKALG
jgi:hypothetical protein